MCFPERVLLIISQDLSAHTHANTQTHNFTAIAYTVSFFILFLFVLLVSLFDQAQIIPK